MKKPGPSIINMAEAMLEEDYKKSHTDLKEWGEENEKQEKDKASQQGPEKKAPNTKPEETRQESNEDRKSEIRSVVIQLPPSPKRRKISNAFTVGEVVDCKLKLLSRFVKWDNLVCINDPYNLRVTRLISPLTLQ
jgi:hypothetical protein